MSTITLHKIADGAATVLICTLLGVTVVVMFLAILLLSKLVP